MKQDWTGQKILIIGAARQGLSLARYLTARGAQVVINDQHPAEAMKAAMDSVNSPAVEWVLGSHPLELLDGVSRVSVSGGVPLELPLLAEARRRGLPLTNDSQILMEVLNTPVIGITGSAGKTTTTTLVGRMADAAVAQASATGPRKAWVGGNIGLPLIEYVDEIGPHDPVVIEFSSFQLELMTRSPHISAVLNITPNHLDRHGTLEAYTAAKARILDYQTARDFAVLNREDPGSWNLREHVQGKLVSFGRERPAAGMVGTFVQEDQIYYTDGDQAWALLPCSMIRLPGMHHRYNVLAAVAIAMTAGFPKEAIQAGVDGFNGVAHRLEFVGCWNGVSWYNDSIATAPERSEAAVKAFDQPIVLLLGGRDKKLPWEKLAEVIHRRVDHVIVFGEASKKILTALGEIQPGDQLQTIDHQNNLHDAVQAAAGIVEPGDIVLFSPGGTSFDEFKDFEERGERFREWVKALS